MIEFQKFGKIARLNRDIIITEKIDGTNGAVGVTEDGQVYAQSRNRIVTPDDDNFGFARWVGENYADLRDVLGIGLHFGEWWGSGIQRGYGLTGTDKRFSLFNANRWENDDVILAGEVVPQLYCVPVLYKGLWYDEASNDIVGDLRYHGSQAKPGYQNPEGIVIYHTAARTLFKVTLEGDESPKGKV